jgi:hypothetical protein
MEICPSQMKRTRQLHLSGHVPSRLRQTDDSCRIGKNTYSNEYYSSGLIGHQRLNTLGVDIRYLPSTTGTPTLYASLRNKA